MITMFCLVHGEPAANAFAVDIDECKTISHLKKLIKSEKTPRFDDIAADELKLWSVKISIDDTSTLKDLVLENNKEKGVQELLPVKKINKIFPDEPADEYIHIIVERPSRTVVDIQEVQQLRSQLAILQAKLGKKIYNFSVLVGRRRNSFNWPANLETATMSILKAIIMKQYDLKAEFDKEDASLEFTNSSGEKYKPAFDSDFRDMLQGMADKHETLLTVAVSTPSKAFSSYDLKTVCKLYDLGNDSSPSLTAFPRLECGKISNDAYERELDKLMAVLRERLGFTPFEGTKEATRKIYVHDFLNAAVAIFGTPDNPSFTISVETDVDGTYGYGVVDYAINSSHTKQVVGITEVKRDDFNKGVAQNAVQLESCLGRKRKIGDMDDAEATNEKVFGIVSDALQFYFLECRFNGDGKPTFSLSDPVIVSYDPEVMKATVAKVLGRIGWLLEEIKKTEASQSSVKKQRTM